MRSILRVNRSFARAATARCLVTGRATFEGTKAHVASSGIELFHKLEKSNLLITPIIHGPPADVINGPDNDSNVAIVQAVLNNKSNGVYVYNHYTRGAWYSAQVAAMVENGLPRDSVVCIADLGYAAGREELATRLLEASRLSNLAHIDVAIVRAHEYHCNTDDQSVGAQLLNESIDLLETMCAQDSLTSYGLRLDVSPYDLHTPLFEEVEPLYECAGAVPTLELTLNDPATRMQKCDALLYETAPSTAYPASYPVLRASDDDLSANPDVFEATDFEKTRTHTRIAVNPLTCYTGWGDGPEPLKHADNRRKNKIDEYLISRGYDRDSFLMYSAPIGQQGFHSKDIEEKVSEALVTLCPKLKSSKTLQDKALRLVLSIGNDVCVVDSDLSAALGKFNLTVKDVLSAKDSDNVFGQFQIVEGMVEDYETEEDIVVKSADK